MIMFELLSLARALLAEQGEEDQAEQWYRKAADASANAASEWPTETSSDDTAWTGELVERRTKLNRVARLQAITDLRSR
jgi:hypothetical protein